MPKNKIHPVSNWVQVISNSESFIPRLDASYPEASRKLLRIKVTPDLHLTYSKNGGNGVVIENEKYSLYLNVIDKTCKIYLFLFV